MSLTEELHNIDIDMIDNEKLTNQVYKFYEEIEGYNIIEKMIIGTSFLKTIAELDNKVEDDEKSTFKNIIIRWVLKI
jgi:hypothetical protein